jgi:hypothetical protein
MTFHKKSELVIKDAVYDQIDHANTALKLIAIHTESKAPLYGYPELLNENECKGIIKFASDKWQEHTESISSGDTTTCNNIQHVYLSSSEAVLVPVLSQLKAIAPNWASVGGWKVLRYAPGGVKLPHTDSYPTVFAPVHGRVDNDNRYQYMRQASLIVYLNNIEAGDGGVTTFYNTDCSYALIPRRGNGVLHPCISATQESSSDTFCKLDPCDQSSFTSTSASSEYRLRDTSWFHESSELVRGEKYILVGFLFNTNHCPMDTELPKNVTPFCVRFDPRSIYPLLLSGEKVQEAKSIFFNKKKIAYRMDSFK